MKTLVFGASGSVGMEVVKELQARESPVHAVRRQKTSVSTGSLQWFEHDIQKGPGSDELWSGVSRVFLMSPPGFTEQDKILLPVIEKAKRQGVKKLVLMTAMGVNHAVGSPLQKVEQALKNSGISHAIIRPNWFMQNFHSYWGEGIRKGQVLFVPGGQAKVSFIDVRDIGAVAARLLISDQVGEFDLTGAHAYTHEEAARILSEGTNRSIRYVDADPQEFKAALIKAGLPQDYAEFMIVIYGALRQGFAAPVTPHPEQILGRKALSLADYVRDYRKALAS